MIRSSRKEAYKSPAPRGISRRSYAEVVTLPAELLDVGVRYMEQLKEKALRVSSALQAAGVAHAVIGGLAVAAHVARVDRKAERNTQDLDILLRKSDLEHAKKALEPLGYRFRKVMKLHAFMPKERGASFVDGVHVIWSGEKVREDYLFPTPDLSPRAATITEGGIQYIGLLELVTMKLTSFRHKDITHVQDLMSLKLITRKIEDALPPGLQARLKQVKEDTRREKLG
jgi:hypothetical protein